MTETTTIRVTEEQRDEINDLKQEFFDTDEVPTREVIRVLLE